jgi:hypothetical protein
MEWAKGLSGLANAYNCGGAGGVSSALWGAGVSWWGGLTGDDPRAFGNSFGTALITAATVAAPKASCLGAFGKCFVAGTPVLMADGTWLAVEKVRAGDYVLTRDAGTGRLEKGRVIEPYVRQSNGTIRLTFSSGLSVETTSEHPFFIEGRGWVEAGKLERGVRVAARESDKSATLERVEKKPGKRAVYNFEVEGTHSYFVGDRQNPKAGEALWVHNYVSRIGAMGPPFVRLASRLGSAESGLNRILNNFHVNGNINIGIGARAIGDGFYELRTATLGRAIVKNVNGSWELYAKFKGHVRGDAANSATIQSILDRANELGPR